MVLGLDLQGGAHFLLKVDTDAVLKNKLLAMQNSIRTSLKDKEIKRMPALLAMHHRERLSFVMSKHGVRA